MSNFGATFSPIFAFAKSIACPLKSPGTASSTSRSRFATEIRTFSSYSFVSTSVGMSRRIFSPSAIRNSPPETVAGMKQTKAPYVADFFSDDSLCSPM